jgi:flagellar basal body P-ring formation protein FlgA
MRHFCPFLLLALPSPAAAQVFENLDQLDARIAETAVAAQPIDRRLRLAPCPEPATIDPPALGAIAIRCPARSWRIRVPLLGKTAEILVRKGDVVTLAYTGSGFDILTTVTAQEDGPLGAPVRVKPPTGNGFLTARVTGAGQVEIRN